MSANDPKRTSRLDCGCTRHLHQKLATALYLVDDFHHWNLGAGGKDYRADYVHVSFLAAHQIIPRGPDPRPVGRRLELVPTKRETRQLACPKEDVMKSMSRIFLILTLLLSVTVLASSASLAGTKIKASIFSYDGENFVRTETTLKEKGQAVAGTKLDRDSAAYKALVEKRSYSGPATLFGRDYEAHYAPLSGEDGKLTGALFVGVPK